MRQQSLLSQLSSISQISNVSYREQKKQYSGSDFFRQSLPPGHDIKPPMKQFRQEEVQIDSLGVSTFKPLHHYKQPGAFTLYWANELNQNIEGTSDNEHDENEIKVESREKIEEEEQSPISGSCKSNQKNQRAVESCQESGEIKILKNETKNIPKNYGKAIIIYIEKNMDTVLPIMEANSVDYNHVINKLKGLKKKINTIADLRNIWGGQPESKCLRIISNHFLRKHSLHYIYNSRIKTRLCHAKYKKRLQEAIMNPLEFNHIKDY